MFSSYKTQERFRLALIASVAVALFVAGVTLALKLTGDPMWQSIIVVASQAVALVIALTLDEVVS